VVYTKLQLNSIYNITFFVCEHFFENTNTKILLFQTRIRRFLVLQSNENFLLPRIEKMNTFLQCNTNTKKILLKFPEQNFWQNIVREEQF